MSLRYAILATLVDRPATGYDITKRIDGSIGFFWGAVHQQVYRELALLDDEGWIEFEKEAQDGKPDKKIYHLTKQGLRALKAWVASPLEQVQTKDALLIKIFCGHVVSAEVLRAEILRHEQTHAERYAAYREIEREYFSDPDHLPERRQFQYLALRRGLVFEKGWLGWCREVLTLLDKKCAGGSP